LHFCRIAYMLGMTMDSKVSERIVVVRGDITTQRVDAIVNASNPSLLPATGICQAIHRVAGHRLAFDCAKLGGCQRGEAKITPGHRLPASYVIHTVAPEWKGGKENEAEVLASCYANCLRLASENRLQSIAFPSIGTRTQGYPVEKASRIAIRTIASYLEKEPNIQKAVVVCFTDEDEAEYERAFREVLGGAATMA
jgi:O-acetyl-ADP-ribose deacetylase (regulator of RNase III)